MIIKFPFVALIWEKMCNPTKVADKFVLSITAWLFNEWSSNEAVPCMYILGVIRM